MPVGESVIGVSFDGTGYGEDGSIWGGEILASDYAGYRRVGSIVPFKQIGGDASAREGWRIAVAMIGALYPENAAEVIDRLNICTSEERSVYLNMAEKEINCVTSTSAGRLFDAVSAILGIRTRSTFEGEASMTLEYAAEAYKGEIPTMHGIGTEIWDGPGTDAIAGGFPGTLTGSESIAAAAGRILLPTDRLVKYITEHRLEGEDVCMLARLFHEILADQIVSACRKASEETGIRSCALTGGVFQNRLLLALCEDGLSAEGFTVYRHRMIPPNDGGLALGQAVYGMARINGVESECTMKASSIDD